MQIVAILAVYNEERFIGACLDHLGRNGVKAYVMDNGSTDGTAGIIDRFEGTVVVGREFVPRDGVYRWQALLERKQELATEIEADWFLHMDADEFRVAPAGMGTLAQGIAAVDAAGFNAINFMEYTFVPTAEHPDHDHPDFLETMRWYYPFRPFDLHQVKAWKRQPGLVGLAAGGGHRAEFDGRTVYPVAFPMRHYLYLSRRHVFAKYVQRTYDEAEIERGWHGARARLTEETIALPHESDLRYYTTDEELDSSDPRKVHMLFEDV